MNKVYISNIIQYEFIDYCNISSFKKIVKLQNNKTKKYYIKLYTLCVKSLE